VIRLARNELTPDLYDPREGRATDARCLGTPGTGVTSDLFGSARCATWPTYNLDGKQR